MASRSRSKRASAATGDKLAQAMRDSAQKIWLAGLGAYERAKSEGPRMFETLVEQGKELRSRAAGAADQALKTVREQAGEAQGKWDKLEQVFEDRVSRSLHRLGVLTSREVGDLSRQVDELNKTVRDLMSAGGKPAARKAKKPRTRKAKAKAKRATRASRAPRA
jgi:poly(hydroxyalkanoate) granule-associated protein